MAPGSSHAVSPATAADSAARMRVVVTGPRERRDRTAATLADEPRVREVVGVARRRPEWHVPKVTWTAADVARDDLEPVVRGADAVVHLAWLIQPAATSARRGP